jgi:RNA polymerase sigma-70 factor (ECF subfamily)
VKGGVGVKKTASSAQKEFERVYEDTYDYIYRYVLTKIGSQEAVKDIVQNVYMNYYQKLKDKGIGFFKSSKHYLLKTAKHIIADYYRNGGGEFVQNIDEIEIVDERALKKMESYDSYTFDSIMSALRRSDEITYQIFVMHFVYDCTIKETASRLGISESTVKSKMYRALKKLKREYKEESAYESI